MKEEAKTKEQLINELVLLQQRISDLERAENEHRQVDQVLRLSRERLGLALRTSNAGTWDSDIATDRTTWDDQLHTLFGLAPGTFSGKQQDFLSMLHPDDQERVRDHINAAINQGVEYSTTYRVILPDSRMRFIASRGKVYRDGAGRAIRMLGVSLDISALKEAEEALEESRQQLR